MGPPISTWPYSQPSVTEDSEKSDNKMQKSDRFNKKCILFRLIGPIRLACLNFTFVLLVLQLFIGMNTVRAGPVVFNLDYYQGPSPLARNIRHLPCISRKTSQEGLCMFAIDCLKANGTHLGTCIDRFYFGSCCQIPDKSVLPQIIGNDIEDNGIDGADFVHPQTEDAIESTVSKIPEYIFPTRKPTTTQKLPNSTTTVAQKFTTPSSNTGINDLENKSGDGTALDNKIPDENIKLTTAVTVETTTKSFTTQPTQKVSVLGSTTEIPIKLSTFQSVSGETNKVATQKPTNANVAYTTLSTTSKQTVSITTQASTTQQTPKKPVRPTYKPRPSSKPSNFTRPQPISNTTKPKPLAPSSIYNTTRLPYRPPPRRPPSTRKPLPLPPRLNITIIPQSTSSKPPFTRPSTASITYINTSASTIKETLVTTKLTKTSTTPPTVTTTTVTPSSSTSRPTSTTVEKTTEAVTLQTSSVFSNDISTEISTDPTTLSFLQPLTTESDQIKLPQSANPVASLTSSTETIIVTMEPVSEKENEKPTTESETSLPASLTTGFPPLVTWSSTIDATTKSPENITVANDEVWSPITPPEGWVLISTVPPKPNTSAKTTTTTTEVPTTLDIETTPYIPTKVETTLTETTVFETEIVTEKSPSMETSSPPKLPTSSSSTQSLTSTQTSTTEKATSQLLTTSETPLLEFTVNVTISPTVPTSTSSIGLTTFSSVTSQNVSAVSNVTESLGSTVTDSTLTSLANVTTVTTASTEAVTTAKPLNMSNFKEVCGRRMWPEARIVGGNKSGFGMWPWQISLRQYRTSTYLHKCGAALLNENWAITAAHCVEGVPPSELLIRLGEHDLANDNEPYGYAERRVQLVASHPHFDPTTFEYDLALLRFVEPVSFQPNILPVCVPDNDDNYVGRTAHVTGWGRLYDEGPLPSVLQEVEVPVINNTACEAMYQEAGYNEHIPNIFICAGWQKGGADSCEGDSGGPMVIQRERDGRFILSGIISWGIGCAEPNQPGVYTRISEFRDWINQILQF